jgi:hypothetical protein
MWAALTVVVASQIGQGPVDDQAKHARRDQVVTLHAVVIDKDVAYSDAPVVILGKKRWRTRPLARGTDVRWFKVEPTVDKLSNTPEGSFKWSPIPYAASEVPAWRGRNRTVADVKPLLLSDEGHGLGTMRFQITVRLPDGRIGQSPGVEARRGGPSGGLLPAVHRVSIRKDDSYLGWLSELYGQPYIWASAGHTDRTHQTERLEGADCADFVTYGRRRQGVSVPYTWTGALPKQTTLLHAGTRRADGVFADDQGRPIPFPRPGDIILFPRHVGALVEDRGVPGLLDAEDIMVHTCFARPKEESIDSSLWSYTRIEIRRWK